MSSKGDAHGSKSDAMRSAEIETAYRRLPILPSEEWRLPGMLKIVSRFPSDAKQLPGFSEISEKAARAELDLLATKAGDLSRLLRGLHCPSIAALAALGFVNERHGMVDVLASLEAAARLADVSGVPKNAGKGRPRKLLPRGIALVLAADYHSLTGGPPTVITQSNVQGNPAGGSFLAFVSAIFNALGIQESPETWARNAAKMWRDQHKEKNVEGNKE